ncbi:uncharacterized protein METZ01_LOCUS488115, partial [marine metagenome]
MGALKSVFRLLGAPFRPIGSLMGRFLNTPFRQATAVFLFSYVLIEWGIPLIPPLFGLSSAPVPNTVVLEYLVIAVVGILLWVSDNEERWSEFKQPIHDVLVRPDRRVARGALFVIVPALVAGQAYLSARPDMSAPPSFRAIHPAPPSAITFQGEQMVLD